ncbi:MAG: HAD family hydrolase [Pirellulaceae bacterium]
MASDMAVLFDVDGVLVDSYRAHYEGWLQVAPKWGFSITEDQFARSFGRTSREVVRDTFGMAHLSDDQIRQLDEEKEAAYRAIVAESFPAMEGAAELLADLRAAGVALGIGSSGPPANVAVVADRLGWHWFGAVVTGADVVRGKPDPTVYLLGAERLGMAPQRCIVIEDAPAGIEAARNAGMCSVGLASTGRTRAELHAADLVLDSLRELSTDRLRSMLRTA